MDGERIELYRNGKWFIRENKHRYDVHDERFRVPYDIVHDDHAVVQDGYNLEATIALVDKLATRDALGEW